MTLQNDEIPPFQNTQDIHLTAALLVTMAVQHVGAPAPDIAKLKILRRNTKPDLGLCSMTDGNRAMLANFRDRDLAQRLLLRPEAICEDYEAMKYPKLRDHMVMRSAAITALLLSTAIRPKNAAMTRIGVNLIERARSMIWQAPGDEVKNGVALEFLLPKHVAHILKIYIKRARPNLLDSDSDYLFPGRGGGHISTSYLGQHIGDFVEQEVGVRVTAHRFRHLCGFLFLQDNPNGYEVVRLLLGHTNISTTIRFYAGAEVEEAHQRFDDFMSRRRNDIDPGDKSGPDRSPKGCRRG